MLKKIKYKKIEDYYNDYFEELNKSFDKNAEENLKKVTNFLKKNYKKKIIFLSVEMVDLQQ